jgi:hypothetical protein
MKNASLEASDFRAPAISYRSRGSAYPGPDQGCYLIIEKPSAGTVRSALALPDSFLCIADLPAFIPVSVVSSFDVIFFLGNGIRQWWQLKYGNTIAQCTDGLTQKSRRALLSPVTI